MSNLLDVWNRQDPSGPILVDGIWHVFPDGNGKGGGKGWSHFTSRDLLRWTEQNHSVVAGGDTGSVSKTESGIIALYPDGSPRTLQRQVPTNEASGKLSLDVEWSPPVTAAKKPDTLGVGMRDPTRALKMADGAWYVGAGSGFGGTGPKSNSKTGLPDSGTGCLAWFKATNSTLQDLEYVGCLLENNHTTGFIDPRTVAWNETDRVAAFFECPDVPTPTKFSRPLFTVVLESCASFAAAQRFALTGAGISLRFDRQVCCNSEFVQLGGRGILHQRMVSRHNRQQQDL